MVHFLVGMALLTVAVVLTLRAGHRAGPRHPGGGAGSALWLSRALLGALVVVLAAGAATTGTGPHAGGKGAKRIPLGLEDMTRIHAEIVIAAVVLVLVLLWVLWRTDAPPQVQDSGRILLAVMVVQGVDRLHPVLHPSPRRAGRGPRVRGLDGVVDGPVVPPRPVRSPARDRARDGPRPRRRATGPDARAGSWPGPTGSAAREPV